MNLLGIFRASAKNLSFSKALKLESETDQVREIQRLVEYYHCNQIPPQITEDDVNLYLMVIKLDSHVDSHAGGTR